MAGIVGAYNTVPRIGNIVYNDVIQPVGGSNPVDLTPTPISNMRGQVAFIITSGDNSYTFSFDMLGGFGQFPQDWSQDWYFGDRSNVGCTVTQLQKNRFEIITPVADAGGRRYILEFFNYQSVSPTIQQTSVNTLGNNTLTVRMTKPRVFPGWW